MSPLELILYALAIGAGAVIVGVGVGLGLVVPLAAWRTIARTAPAKSNATLSAVE